MPDNAEQPLHSGQGPALSVVLPIYNAAAWVEPTLAHLRRALERAGWSSAQIVVVDDGSDDGTGAALAADEGTPPSEVLSQPNRGRFLARQAGLEAARGDLVLLLDSRVHLHPDSLAFVRDQIDQHPDRVVWNGHVQTAPGAEPVARFWDAITRIAWRRYLADPTTTSFGAEDFDYYPKGTGLFLAPREALLDACRSFDSGSADLSFASDDTLLLRPLAERYRINISPQFSCTYHPRTTLRQFVQHSYFRGTTFVDGHVRPGARFYKPYLALAASSPVAAVAAARHPKSAGAAVGAGSLALGIAARAIGVPSRDAASLALLAPLFGVVYGAGTVRGLALRWIGRRGSRP